MTTSPITPCFTPGTLIATDCGPVPVEALRRGIPEALGRIVNRRHFDRVTDQDDNGAGATSVDCDVLEKPDVDRIAQIRVKIEQRVDAGIVLLPNDLEHLAGFAVLDFLLE